jgi:hypothetical protein
VGQVWAALKARPSLLVEALSTAWASRVRGGVLPSRHLLNWRLATAYGSDSVAAPADDLIRFLEWRRAVRRSI